MSICKYTLDVRCDVAKNDPSNSRRSWSKRLEVPRSVLCQLAKWLIQLAPLAWLSLVFFTLRKDVILIICPIPAQKKNSTTAKLEYNIWGPWGKQKLAESTLSLDLAWYNLKSAGVNIHVVWNVHLVLNDLLEIINRKLHKNSLQPLSQYFGPEAQPKSCFDPVGMRPALKK